VNAPIVKRRYSTRCLFCRATIHAIGNATDGVQHLSERAARHLRNCSSFAADFRRLQVKEGVELDREVQISTLLHTAGLPIPAGLPAPATRGAA
jgi:hypothetical protein